MTHAIMTGPVAGNVTLPDGSKVDVSPAIIFVDTVEERDAIVHAIGERHAERGHPHHDPEDRFVYDREQSEYNLAHPGVVTEDEARAIVLGKPDQEG